MVAEYHATPTKHQITFRRAQEAGYETTMPGFGKRKDALKKAYSHLI